MAPRQSKIFGIGLSKTGTTSLANALLILGFKTKDNMGVTRYAKGDLASVDLDVIENYDAHTDTPIPSFYRELDAKFPGSKFILTVRGTEAWLRSCKKQFTQRFAQVQTDAHKRLFLDIYGSDVFDEQRFASGYQRFVDGVHEYFRNRPSDLLVMDVSSGEGWDKLCRFLDRPLPDVPFPKANVTDLRWIATDALVSVAVQAGAELLQRWEGAPASISTGNAARQSGLRAATQLLERAAQTMLGRDGVHAALRAAHRVIVRGLDSLAPGVPVLSRAGEPIPFDERRAWNHVWFVDPLDGEGAFASGAATFSVNIALVEDRRPICGVVYLPATGTAYWGMTGKGAYRCERGGEASDLRAGSATDRSQVDETGLGSATGRGNEPSSRALAMLARAWSAPDFALQESMEWHTAAAHAILRCAGMRVFDSETGSELGYNKKDLSNRCIGIGSRSSVDA